MKFPFFRRQSSTAAKEKKSVKRVPSESGSTSSESREEDAFTQNQSRQNKPAISLNPRDLSLEERWSPERVKAVNELWNLNNEQQAKLLELKRRLADIDHWKNDAYEVIRFLLEKRGSVDRAEALFRRVYEWRMENNIDTILDDYQISPLFNYFPIATLQGVDHDGDPIHLERPGAADCLNLFHRLGPNEVYQMAVYMREMDTDPQNSSWHASYLEQSGRPVKYFTIVIDLDGLSRNHMRPAMMAVLGRVLLMSQDHYPHFAKKILLLRAPRIFKLVWSIAQHFVHESVKKLISFSTQQDYLEVIDQHMDRSVMPACICPVEGRGRAIVGFENVKLEGGQLPPSDLTDAEIEQQLVLERQLCLQEQSTCVVRVATQPLAKGYLAERHHDDVVLYLKTPMDATK